MYVFVYKIIQSHQLKCHFICRLSRAALVGMYYYYRLLLGSLYSLTHKLITREWYYTRRHIHQQRAHTQTHRDANANTNISIMPHWFPLRPYGLIYISRYFIYILWCQTHTAYIFEQKICMNLPFLNANHFLYFFFHFPQQSFHLNCKKRMYETNIFYTCV